MQDYMMALYQRFCDTPLPDDKANDLERQLREQVPKDQRRLLTRLLDHQDECGEALAAEAFTAGFRLAAGNAMELRGSWYLFVEDEEHRARDTFAREAKQSGAASPRTEWRPIRVTAEKGATGSMDIRAVSGDGERSAGEIIEEMVVDHAAYGSEAEGEIGGLLAELDSADPAAAAKWRSIMHLWETAGSGIPIYYGVLPDGLTDTDALCIVALGFQLNPDGTLRDELIERLKVVRKSAEKYPNAYIVCTGGGTAAKDESATEAGKMAEWMIENGIESTRVIVEEKSVTTAQNAIYTYDILAERYPQVSQLAIISSDYHIATGALLFGAEATLRAEEAGNERWTVVSNAAYQAPSGSLSAMFQAGALIELSGDIETAFEIYYETYDIHELPPLQTEA